MKDFYSVPITWYPVPVYSLLATLAGMSERSELAWNLLKDCLEDQGFINLIGSKNSTRTAFANGLIKDGETWMDMIKARNLTSHTYNLELAQQMIDDILKCSYPVLPQSEMENSLC